MDLMAKNRPVDDVNSLSNQICFDVVEEVRFGDELADVLLSSATKNLIKMDVLEEFSCSMLKSIELNEFEFVKDEKPSLKTIDEKLLDIQKEIAFDIAKPISNLFDEMSEFVCEAFAK